MLRLIEKGLMFGNLVKVATPALVDRYNAAMEKLCGRRTGLTEFHIDLSGYSPEIGQELGDQLYLNPNGCNRMFILVTPEQHKAPLLHAHFSTSRAILERFYRENAAQLFALTVREAVCGELMNSVFKLDAPADVMNIRTITVEADTVSGHIDEARKLRALVQRFQTEEDGWWNDLLVAEMIQTADRVGDIGRNPVELTHTSYRKGNFQTAHFGGLYIFHELKNAAVIRVDPKAAPGEIPLATVVDLADRKGVNDFLKKNKLVESVFDVPGLDAPALLRQRIDFMLIAHLAKAGEDVSAIGPTGLRRALRAHFKDLPPEGQALADLVRWAEQGGKRPRLDQRNPAYFYTLRARAHEDRDLVNMLLAELTPLDVRQLYICHKEAFFAAYSTWSDAKRTYVADFLAAEYMRDAHGTWEALYGGTGAGSSDPQSSDGKAPDDEKEDRQKPPRASRKAREAWSRGRRRRKEDDEDRNRRRARDDDDRDHDGDDDDDDDDKREREHADDGSSRDRNRRGPWGVPVRERKTRGPWSRGRR